MIDINILRNNPEIIIKDLEKRKDKDKLKLLKKIQDLDKQYRQEQYNLQLLKSSRNKINQEINQLKKAGKDIKAKIRELKDLPKKVNEKQKKVDELKLEIKESHIKLKLSQ